MELFIYICVCLYGILIGSFLNVCILRIPKKESIVKVRSHCTSCQHVLAWYELIPLFSYLFLGGRCRKCRAKISLQYPLVELLNGIIYLVVFLVNGINAESVVYCLCASALLALSIIDLRTFEIPFGFNVFLFAMGVVHLFFDIRNWISYVIGFFAVSTVLFLIRFFTGGRAMGGGDVKLMAAAGLLVGWERIVLAFFLGCILASVIHVMRMKFFGAGRKLAFGPYLSMSVFLCMLWGNQMIDFYFGLLGCPQV